MARVRSGIANQYQRDAYMVLDASVAWNRSWLHPYVRATNLTDITYQPILGIVMPGRAVIAGIEICAVCRGK
jgi:outer membrane receptor protein involved in Fe transport